MIYQSSFIKRCVSLASAFSMGLSFILLPLSATAQEVDTKQAIKEVIQYIASLHNVEFFYQLGDRPLSSDCGVIEVAAFCPQDNTVYINVAAVSQISDNPIFPIFAAAHETAHAIQWNLGIGGIDNPTALSIGVELQADCLAGDALSWVFTKLGSELQFTREEYQQLGYLVSDAAAEVGTEIAHSNFGLLPSHPTSEQRASAVLSGYNGEDYRVCLQ